MAGQTSVNKPPVKEPARVHSSFFKSTTFEFRVEDQKFFVHRDLLSSCSKPLDRVVNVDMQEKHHGFALLTGVNAATFERFSQWLYTGEYQIPEPKLQTTTNNGPKTNKKDFTCLFRAHIELYVFAEEKDVQGLKDAVLKKIYETKKVWTSDGNSSNMEGITEYVYQHTVEAKGPQLEPLRAFAMSYVTSFSGKSIVESAGLHKLLRTGGDDLLKMSCGHCYRSQR